MKNTKKNWLSRLFKSFRSSSQKSGYKPQPLRIENLEERAMLNVAPVMTLDSTTYDITSNCPWYIPLTSYDTDKDMVFYKVEVLSGDLTCDLSVNTAWNSAWSSGLTKEQVNTICENRNPYWLLTVYQEGNDILNGEDSQMLFELFYDKAPITVDRIIGLTLSDLSLSENKTEKFYDNTIFHRVIQNFMSQGGAYDIYGNDRSSVIPNLADEFNDDLQMNSTGVLAMANTGYKDTGSSQFFVTSRRCNWLNYKHSVFGFLIDGQEVQAEINKQGNDYNSTPNPEVVITDATCLYNYFCSTLTVRSTSNTITSSTIRVTPYDEHGLAGQSQIVTVNVVPETQLPVFYNLESPYLLTTQGNNLTHTFEVGYTTGERVGFYAELSKIVRDEAGNVVYEDVDENAGNKAREPKFEIIPNGASANYETGEVTAYTEDLEPGDYYLSVYALEYKSDHTFQRSDILTTLNVPIIVEPNIPTPTSVSLLPADDTGVIGDGITSKTTGLTFTVEGVGSQYITGLYAVTSNGYESINMDVAEEGSSTVDIVSQTYDSYGNVYPIEFDYGTYTVVAVNFWERYFYVSPEKNNGTSTWYRYYNYSNISQEFVFKTTLPTPENITASGITYSGFNLSWSTVDGADSYYLEFRKKGEEEWIGGTVHETFCSFNEFDLDTIYEIRVSAYNSSNVATKSEPSDILEVRTLGLLNPPSNVWAEIDNRTISVSWDAVNNASAYNVYYRELGTESWNVGEENVTALTCQFNLPEGANASFYEVAVQAISASGYGPSDAAIALTCAGDMPLLTATLTTWNGRNESVIPVSVNEWEFLNLQLTANPEDVVDNGGVSIVFQYDATLFKPDWANSEFYGIEYSYRSVPLDEYGTIREVTIIAAVTDPTLISNDLVANVKMIPANPSDFMTQDGVSLAGVALKDETRNLTITVFTDTNNTLSTANVITTPVWAVPYDLDDSGVVDVRDFILFATYFGSTPDSDVKDISYFCNFDAIGSVDVKDFMLFATNYGMSYAKNGANIEIKNQDKADALNAQGAAPVAEPIIASAKTEELNQTVVTTILLEPIQDGVLTPVSSSNTSFSDYYFADVLLHSNAVNTLSNQTEQAIYADSSENYTFVHEEGDASSSLNETDALNPENVDLFFELELFNDDENSDLEDELSEELLPSLPNHKFFTN